jgi:hypothetical protein
MMRLRLRKTTYIIFFRYLECGGSGGTSGLVTECLERLSCLTHDKKIKLPTRDREVATM